MNKEIEALLRSGNEDDRIIGWKILERSGENDDEYTEIFNKMFHFQPCAGYIEKDEPLAKGIKYMLIRDFTTSTTPMLMVIGREDWESSKEAQTIKLKENG